MNTQRTAITVRMPAAMALAFRADAADRYMSVAALLRQVIAAHLKVGGHMRLAGKRGGRK